MIKFTLLMVSLTPLGLQIPHLLTAWRTSRLDHWDWIFYLLACPAVWLACRRKSAGQVDWYALCLLIPMAGLALTTCLHKVNAVGIAASVLCVFASVWWAASWRIAVCLLPAVVILLLGTPSSSYWISLLLMAPVWGAWLVKFLLAILCFIWIICNGFFKRQISKGTLFFCVAFLGSCLLLLHSREICFVGKSFIPEFAGHCGEFWGRSIEPDENTKRFFVTGQVKQFRYTRNETDISVLAVKCGKDIHEIHPASHCLRTSFWTVHSEKTLYLQDNFAVTEIDAEKGTTRILVWVWYSGERFSTPGFLSFRRHFRSGGEYYTYQLSTPSDGDIDRSRADLQQFIRALKSRRTGSSGEGRR